MFKLINLRGDSIRLDDKGVSEMVTDACRRAGVYVEGICTLDDEITLICSDHESDDVIAYRFTALGDDVVADDVYAVLRSRYDGNFRTVGAFRLADGFWTLTEQKKFVIQEKK